MKQKVLKLARYPSTSQTPGFNFCSAMKKSCYVSILLKNSKGMLKQFIIKQSRCKYGLILP